MSKTFGGSFIRNPHSGAFVGGLNSHRLNTLSPTQIAHAKADIIAPDHMPGLVLECKSYKDFCFHGLMRGSVSELDNWIRQCLEIVSPSDEWFIAFKINRLGWWISIPEHQAEYYQIDSHTRYQGKHGVHLVTDLLTFIERNRDTILTRCA